MASPYTDGELIKLFFARDEQALSITQNQFGKFILSVCFSILRQQQDSEECANTVLLKLWNTIPPEEPRNLKAYIAKVSRNAAIDVLRSGKADKRNATVESLEDLSDVLADGYSLSEGTDPAEISRLLNGFLGSLPKRERVCFVKRYFFNCTVEEITGQTGIPHTTVYNILERVKKKLKKLLEENNL